MAFYYRRKKGRNSARRALRRNRYKIYDRPGTSNCKVNLKGIFETSMTEIGTTGKKGFLTRSLYSEPITDIPHGDDLRNTRQNNVVELRGIKLEYAISNIERAPLCVNMALLHGRSSSENNNAIATVEFFRSYNEDRGLTFPSAGYSSIFYMNQPVNTDKYTMLWKQKYMLPNPIINDTPSQAEAGEFPDAFENRMKKSYKMISSYIPFKRQLRYEDDSKTYPTDGHVFLVIWVERLLDTTGASGGSVPAARFQGRVIRYFREGRR